MIENDRPTYHTPNSLSEKALLEMASVLTIEHASIRVTSQPGTAVSTWIETMRSWIKMMDVCWFAEGLGCGRLAEATPALIIESQVGVRCGQWIQHGDKLLTDTRCEAVPSAAHSGYRRFLRIETATLIAASLGAFTMSGYVHLEKYYQTLNVSIDRLNFGAQKYAIYGGASIVTWIAAVLFGIAAALLIAVMLALLELPGKQSPAPQSLPSWMARLVTRASELSTPLKITAAALAIAGFALIS